MSIDLETIRKHQQEFQSEDRQAECNDERGRYCIGPAWAMSHDIDALIAEIYRLRDRHADIVGSLYGQGFEVLGWHLNGDTEPLDNWFENNDWLDTPDNTQESKV